MAGPHSPTPPRTAASARVEVIWSMRELGYSARCLGEIDATAIEVAG